MTVDERLIGFDARELWLGEQEHWGAAWKSSALLRDDIDKPLSIDREVWASLFDLHDEVRPSYTGLFHGLWNNLDQLVIAVNACRATSGPVDVVAFTIAALSENEWENWKDVVSYVSPPTVDAGWVFLGYDVADGSGTSSLVTMRVPTDADMLRQRFGPLLNRAHLFIEQAPAREFRDYSTRAIPRHAPFFVYGVRQVRHLEDPT